MKWVVLLLMCCLHQFSAAQIISSHRLHDDDSLRSYSVDTPYIVALPAMKPALEKPKIASVISLDEAKWFAKQDSVQHGTNPWVLELIDTVQASSYGYPFIIDPLIMELPIPDKDSTKTYLLQRQSFENCYNLLIARVKSGSLIQLLHVGPYDYMGEGISRRSATWLSWNNALNSWDILDLNYEMSFLSGKHEIHYAGVSHYVINPYSGRFDLCLSYNYGQGDEFVKKYLALCGIKAPITEFKK